MNRLLLILGIGFLLAACSKEEITPYPCLNGDCNALFFIDEQVQPNAYEDANGYWHIEYYGPKYFTIRGELSELHDEYVIDGVPLVEVIYDSDYWVAFDSIQFTVSTWSVLSWFDQWNNPILLDNITYTLTDIAQIQPPLNISGYQINRYFDFTHPAAKSMLGTRSKYNYNPRQQFYLNNDMVGDTLQVFTRTLFNTDIGDRIEIDNEFKIIVH